MRNVEGRKGDTERGWKRMEEKTGRRSMEVKKRKEDGNFRRPRTFLLRAGRPKSGGTKRGGRHGGRVNISERSRARGEGKGLRGDEEEKNQTGVRGG